MPITRRELLKGAGGLVVGLQLLGPAALAGPPAVTASRRRLLLVFQLGGSDGLNVVVPRADLPGAPRLSVYRKVRPSLGYQPSQVLGLDRPGDADHGLGLNPRLARVHDLYRQGRVAVVQGVDYPGHSYSHFTASDIWESGAVDGAPSSGWLGRHLDRAGVGDAELRAVAVGSQLPLALRGARHSGTAVRSIPEARFADGESPMAKARHEALARFHGDRGDGPLRAAVARTGSSTVGLVGTLSGMSVPPSVAPGLVDQLVTARLLFEEPGLGVEVVVVIQPGYDTHTNQRGQHEALLGALDDGLGLFWDGTYRGDRRLEPMAPDLASRMLVMTSSEFGRRIGENGVGQAAGTDHGGSAPVLLIGGPGGPLVGGIHGDHPDLGTPAAPADDLAMTTDLRRLYQSVLSDWLHDPDPAWARARPLPGLFR